jgi:hypothetical protein
VELVLELLATSSFKVEFVVIEWKNSGDSNVTLKGQVSN